MEKTLRDERRSALFRKHYDLMTAAREVDSAANTARSLFRERRLEIERHIAGVERAIETTGQSELADIDPSFPPQLDAIIEHPLDGLPRV